MFRRLFWLLIGAGVAIWAYTTIRGYLRQASPEAIGHRVAESATGIGASAQDFVARVREGMAEREAELRAAFPEGGAVDQPGERD